MQKIAIIGTTSWAIPLAVTLANKGTEGRLWARTQREAGRRRKSGSDRFPDIKLPKLITITHQIAEALSEANAVILPVPSATMRQNISRAAAHLRKSTIIISASKGLEIGRH